jgi:RNA polymerase sigma-70 factor (ECF subfamily)
VESFETYRPYLFSIAYRMLGSAMDTEDMVQETYLRYQGTPKDSIRSLKAFLTTIITRLCVDQLQLARRKREVYVAPWLPEPILTAMTPASEDPAGRVEREESISLAFLLHEVFEYAFAEIATMLGKSEAACRRSFSRTKKHLAEHRPRFPASAQTHRQLLSGYLQAAQGGDITPLMDLLSENVTLWTDAGGKLKQAALRPIVGRDAVARFSLGTMRFLPEDSQTEIVGVNGQAALITRAGGQALFVLTIEVEEGHIQAIRIIANPEKLARL